MIFHEANKLSSNVTSVRRKTLNVIPYFQDRAFGDRAACYSRSLCSWNLSGTRKL
jgi:hypothetical protein